MDRSLITLVGNFDKEKAIQYIYILYVGEMIRMNSETSSE